MAGESKPTHKVRTTEGKRNSIQGLPIGMCLGLSIGTAIGAATDNIGLWMLVGLSMGICLGTVLGHSDRKNDSKDGNNEQDCREDGNDEKK